MSTPYTQVYGKIQGPTPYTQACGHVGSSTRLITVKSHLEFSSFGDAFSLIVPIVTMYYLKG